MKPRERINAHSAIYEITQFTNDEDEIQIIYFRWIIKTSAHIIISHKKFNSITQTRKSIHRYRKKHKIDLLSLEHHHTDRMGFYSDLFRLME